MVPFPKAAARALKSTLTGRCQIEVGFWGEIPLIAVSDRNPQAYLSSLKLNTIALLAALSVMREEVTLAIAIPLNAIALTATVNIYN
ncbi:MAG: hypothetical protein AAFY20_18500 [Cyanobacteria bacterium J06639_14]